VDEFFPDLDGDGTEEASLLAWYSFFRDGCPGLDLDALKEAVATGSTLLVLEVQRCGESDHTRMRLHVAEDADGDPANDFSGEGRFAIVSAVDPARPTAFGTPRLEIPSVGSVRDDVLLAKDGAGPIAPALLFMNDPPEMAPTWVLGQGLTVSGRLGDGEIDGMLAFGLWEPDAQLIYPPFADALNAASAADPEPFGCGAQVRGWFDHDSDGTITAEESQVEAILADSPGLWAYPEADLAAGDADGNIVWWPAYDGDAEHLSFAFGFHAVPAIVEP
jgi:hypothetical protein